MRGRKAETNLCELSVSAVKQTLPQRRRDAEGGGAEEDVKDRMGEIARSASGW